jgi:hypothetical protein
MSGKQVIWAIAALLILLLVVVSVRAWVGTADPASVGVNEGAPGRSGNSL